MAAQKMKNGPSENKPNRGLRGAGVEDMEFQGYWRKKMWNKFQESISWEKEVEFPEVQQGKTHEISMGLAFWPCGISKGVTQFCWIYRDESLFSLE